LKILDLNLENSKLKFWVSKLNFSKFHWKLEILNLKLQISNSIYLISRIENGGDGEWWPCFIEAQCRGLVEKEEDDDVY